MGIGRFAYTPLLPLMRAQLGLSLLHSSWLASANYAGYLVGALCAAAIPLPSHRVIGLSLLLIGLATAAMGVCTGLPAWLALRALAGAASAWAMIHISSTCVQALAPLGRPWLVALVFSGVGLGIALTGLVCLGLLALGAGPAQVWILLGALALAGTFCVGPLLRPAQGLPGARASVAPRPGTLWGRLPLVFCYGALGFGYIIPATFLPAMARALSTHPALFDWAWPVFGAAAALSTPVAAALQRRLGNRRLWLWAQAIMAVGVAGPAVFPGMAAILLAALLVGSTFMVATMAAIGRSREVAGEGAAELIALMTSAFALGQVAGPLTVGVLPGSGEGFGAPLAMASALLIRSSAVLALGREAAKGS